MKHTGYVFLAEIVLVGTLVTLSGAQSEPLGDYARAVRKGEKKESVKKYDNDNLPTNDKISIVGNAQESGGAEDANPAPTSEGTAVKPGDASTTATPESQSQDTAKKSEGSDTQKVTDEWKQKISDQKAKVDLLSRELDVFQREYRLRAAAFYADAGNRLRNQGSWDKEDAQYKQQLAQKQKALDDAKKALDDMREQARKAGVPPRARE
jgi:hypothetical protein